MNRDKDNKGSLIPASSSALERTEPKALTSTGLHDFDGDEARNRLSVESSVAQKAATRERCCTEHELRLLFCLEHQCTHDQCPNELHLDFALVRIERIVRLPRFVPHLWAGPDDIAHGFPPGCSYCGESDPTLYGKPCPKRGCNTWYELLGVAEDAELNQINDAYRKLASEWNPERFRHPDDKVFDASYSATQMMWLNAAYAVLKDPAMRQQYDAVLLRQRLKDPEWFNKHR